MEMEMCWMFLLLLLCRLTWSELVDTSKYKYEVSRVSSGGSVIVPCPNNTAEDGTFNLYQDEREIYSYAYVNGKARDNRPSEFVELLNGKYNQSVSFKLSRVNGSSCGIYKCESVVIFPPPTVTYDNNLRIVLLVKAPSLPDCPVSPDSPTECGFNWIWIAAICAVYGVIITIVAIVIQVRMRNAECQNEYMNTKPKPPRDRKKKKGVQNPAPWYC